MGGVRSEKLGVRNVKLRVGASYRVKIISYRRDRACPCPQTAKVGSDSELHGREKRREKIEKRKEAGASHGLKFILNNVGRGLAPAVRLLIKYDNLRLK